MSFWEEYFFKDLYPHCYLLIVVLTQAFHCECGERFHYFCCRDPTSGGFNKCGKCRAELAFRTNNVAGKKRTKEQSDSDSDSE